MKIIPAIFEHHEIRRLYDEPTETWFFSVVDIIQVLTQQADFQKARKYWNKLKERLGQEGSQLVTSCHRLKLPADDGKMRFTDVANAETLLRLVQSVPSPKAEPIKLWLAKVGYERMQELADPALALERARETWQKHGRSEKWIQQRMTGQETRNKLTDYWASHEVTKEKEYAILTNIIHQEWSGVSVQAHKNLKGIKNPEPPRSHERGGTHLYRPRRTLHAPDCRDHRRHRPGRKSGRREDGRPDLQTRPPGTGSYDRPENRDRRKFSAAGRRQKRPQGSR